MGDAIITRVPWTVQPQIIPRVNWGNPITQGLRFLAVPAGTTALDIVSGVLGTASGGIDRAIYPPTGGGMPSVKSIVGIGGTVGSSNGKIEWPSGSGFGGDITDTCTLLSLGGVLASTNVHGGNGDTGTNGAWTLMQDMGSQIGNGYLINRNALDTATIMASPSAVNGTGAAGKICLIGYGTDTAGTNWFAQGATTTDADTNSVAVSANRKTTLLQSPGASVRNNELFIGWFALWARKLSAGEYLALWNNPWQLFAPLPRRIWAPAAAAGGFKAYWANRNTRTIGMGRI